MPFGLQCGMRDRFGDGRLSPNRNSGVQIVKYGIRCVSIMAFASFFFLSFFVHAREETASQRVISQASTLLANLKATRYSHRTHVDEERGVVELDCSGLAFFLLRKAAPRSLLTVPIAPGRRRSRAIEFYQAFARAPVLERETVGGWKRVLRLLDAQPGDFIAWRVPVVPTKGDTGHIAVILQKPVLEKDGIVRVVILDSTGSRHAMDSRRKGSGGVGKGVMWYAVDRAGTPIAYYWSSLRREPKAVPIAIGRPIDPAAARMPPPVFVARARREQLSVLGSSSLSIDPTNPGLPSGVREGEKVIVRRHGEGARAEFTVRFRSETPGSWRIVRMTRAGRTRLGPDVVQGERLMIEKIETRSTETGP